MYRTSKQSRRKQSQRKQSQRKQSRRKQSRRAHTMHRMKGRGFPDMSNNDKSTYYMPSGIPEYKPVKIYERGAMYPKTVSNINAKNMISRNPDKYSLKPFIEMPRRFVP
jgi:hypothetical protein